MRNYRPFRCCADACTRATFSHKNRPICHFELVGKSVFFSPQATPGAHPQLSIRGTAGGFGFCVLPGVAPLSGGSNACVAGGMIMPPRGVPRGVSPSGRFFGDFLIEEKVTRGRRGGAPSPRGTLGLLVPHKLPGWSACSGGCEGKMPPLGECNRLRRSRQLLQKMRGMQEGGPLTGSPF